MTTRMLFLLWLVVPHGVSVQTTTPVVTTVTVTVLDEAGEPVAYLPVELYLFRYAESVELVGAGGCGTDETGSCAVVVSDPPSASGWMEGMVFIPGLGTEYIGWQGAEKTVVIQLLPGNVMATPETFLHPPFDEQPESTDLPQGLAWVQTLTRTPTNTASETSPPTGTPPPSETPAPSETLTPAATAIEQESSDSGISVAAGLLIAFGLPVMGLLAYWLYFHKDWQEDDA